MKISIDPRIRHTLRGLKRCPSCGEINGQRAFLCRNEGCELRRKTLANQRPFDPVALVAHTSGCSLYSVRSKERGVQPRNFVTITEVTLALEEPNSAIVSRNAICFVDTCKYDASDAAHISCKHIRACTTLPAGKAPMPHAEAYKVSREVLYNLNIDASQKQRLWDLCKENEARAPAVQRLNATTFAVKCVQTKVFPAGWLHVTVVSNTCNAAASKKVTQPHACACKKLKIILEPDNSVVMQEEICDHLLLVLAAILSKKNGKEQFAIFANALQSFWMPNAWEWPMTGASEEDTYFSGLSINIDGSVVGDGNEQTATDDIFVFGNEYLADDTIPDFSDIVLDLGTNNVTTSTHSQLPTAGAVDLLHPGDPNMMSSCTQDEDIEMNFANVITPDVHGGTDLDGATHLELSDCNIELMDQFHQLTDQIDLCSDDIALPIESTKELFDTKNVSILASPRSANIMLTPYWTPTAANVTGPGPLNSTTQPGCSLLKSSQLLPAAATTLPPIELPTIAVVKKCPVKTADIVTEVKTRKFPHIPAKRALIVNSSLNNAMVKKEVDVAEHPATEPSLSYSAWLEHIIELMSDSICIVEETDVLHTFHVHEEIFAHFSKSFSVGVKWRMPNTTTLVKSGKHKGLIKYTWYFPTASTVQRIFSTKNVSLQLDRAFERSKDGTYVPYVRATNGEPCGDQKKRRIYPKLELYMAHMWFDCGNSQHKTGLKLEWLPNAFPKSHYGVLSIEFSLGIRDPHTK